MSRTSPLDRPGALEKFAELYAAGLKREELAEEFDVSKDSVSRWLRREDVQMAIAEVNRRRTNRIVRKIDSQIEARLGNDDQLKNMDVKDLLAIRRELVPQKLEVGKAGDFEAAEAAMWDALDRGEEPKELEPPEEEPVEAEAEELTDEDRWLEEDALDSIRP